jgi:predicted outer membrane repeat protein
MSYSSLAFLPRILVAGIICALVGTLEAAVRSVPQQHSSIQACIDAAADYDQCVVAPGTYHERINFLGKPIQVRSVGGPEVTIIDATGLNESVVLAINEESNYTILEGFTIQGGVGTYFVESQGGGMLTWNSRPTIINCLFRDNFAKQGGGVHNHYFSAPVFIECTFENNHAEYGGGMSNEIAKPILIDCHFESNNATAGGGGGMWNANSEPIVVGCDFRRNRASWVGGGMHNVWSNPLVHDCLLESNHAGRGGGMYSYSDSHPRMKRVTFARNTAADAGGGAYYDEFGGELVECSFIENEAAKGGALYHEWWSWQDHSSVISNCHFTGNQAVKGGAVHTPRYADDIRFEDCTFERNQAVNGGAYFVDGDNEVVLNACTFAENYAEMGGAIYSTAEGPRAEGCTFTANRAKTSGGAIYIEPSYKQYILHRPTVTSSTFQQNEAPAGGAIYSGAFLRVSESGFAGNEAHEGGAIHLTCKDNEILDSSFVNNRAVAFGGAIYDCTIEDSHIAASTFRGNSAELGGAIYSHAIERANIDGCLFEENLADAGGAVSIFADSARTISRCAFHANKAMNGGAIFNLYESTATIRNSLFTANEADSGGAIYNDANLAAVEHCTFFTHSPAPGSVMINSYYSQVTIANTIIAGEFPAPIMNEADSAVSLRFSSVPGGVPASAVDEGGNVFQDPAFMRIPSPGPDGTWGGADDDRGDLRLRPASPCINAGDPAFAAEEGETDLDSHGRVLCGQTDMGAYEFGIGDYDCDKAVGLPDLVAWPICMNGPNGGFVASCEPVDFNANGAVDLLDYAQMQLLGLGK